MCGVGKWASDVITSNRQPASFRRTTGGLVQFLFGSPPINLGPAVTPATHIYEG